MSGAKATVKVSNPDCIDVTVSITMSLYNWRRLKEQLDNVGSFPSYKLRNAIVEALQPLEAAISKTAEFSE